MGSLVETIQKKKRFPQLIPRMPYKDDLPIFSSSQSASSSSSSSSSKGADLIGIRKRISSFSVNIQPACLASTASSAWAFRKSRSMPSLGEYFAGVGRWWERSWGWLLSKKPSLLARDIEMNEEEMAILGCRSKGTLRHVLYKIRRLVRAPDQSTTTTPLPMTHNFRCDSFTM